MNQDLLVRLFRSIEGERNDDVVKVAGLIIEDEKKRGHSKLADKLKSILDKNIQTQHFFKGELKKLLPQGTSIPTDKRYKIPLATYIERDELRHEMILPVETEEKIRRIEKEYAARERLAKHGLKYRQKILLFGAPGCGKSMSAERIAWNLGLPLLKVKFDVIISSYLGETASNLNKLFEGVKDFPCVLLFDEFDIIGKTRTHIQDLGEMHRIVNILLTLLEDYDAPGLLIATTNMDSSLDNALFRRFDDIIQMPKPSKPEIIALAKMSLSSINKSANINWKYFADQLAGHSSALIVKVANDAAKFSVIAEDKTLQQMHIEKAVKENLLYKK